ncbi:MAG: RnfABCDGE type electron transport complex subunit D, partial [Nevskiales bacterium]
MSTLSSPHLPVQAGVSAVMRAVLLALIPGLVAYVLFFGYGVLINLLLASATALLTEAAMLRLRGRPVTRFISDNSALVTAVLLGIALPPLAPWWLVVIGTSFALVFGKHLYGGLGYNPFNPAMLGYVVLLISFPTAMTTWPAVQPLMQPTLNL